MNNCLRAWVRIMLRCVPHQGEARPMPGPSLTMRDPEEGWQEAKADLPLEWLNRTALPGYLTVSPLLPPGHQKPRVLQRELQGSGGLRATWQSPPLRAYPYHAQLLRRSSAPTLSTLLAPAPSPPAQAPLGPPRRHVAPAREPSPSSSPLPSSLLNPAPAPLLSPHPG